MTIWSPRLPETPQPIYRRIADALEHDVRTGLLVAGSQLPTHRELARSLDITPVTVTRAYGEAARRGLIESSTGRGTFVRVTRRELAPMTEIDLATNTVAIPLPFPTEHVLRRAGDAMVSSSYNTGPGSERHRAAGAMWIGRRTDPSRVLVTAGTQHALLLALAATARAGDTILCESSTYHGARAAASLLGIRLEGVAMDRHGLLPDALERAARGKSKVLYTIPSLQNPTGSVMPEKRRREIASIAEVHGLTIIEDDVCGFLFEQTPPPIASFAPDRTIFITGLGKAVAPGLRVGYFTASEPLLARAQTTLAASILFASPVLAELAATWLEDGTVARIVATKRAEVKMRSAAARRILGKRIAASSDPRSSHLWIELAKRWNPDAFVEEARRRRVRVASASSFAVTGDVPRAIRLSIGAPVSMGELENALHVVAGIEEQRAPEPVV